MKRNKTLVLLVLIALLVLLILLALLGIHTLNSRTANTSAERVNLPAGTTYPALLDSLAAHQIQPTTPLRLMARGLHLDKQVRPGSYLVEPHMRTLSLVRKLRNGQQDPIRLTIGKFRTPEQLNDYLNQKLMHNTFNFTLSTFHLVLPDTYEFYWTVSPEAFMQRMEKEYRNAELRMKNEKLADAPTPHPDNSTLSILHYSFKDIIILASIVEEETNYGPEKPVVASVYLNRLKRGMPLQADPTVRYAVGDFALQRILNKHLAVESPFNTYLHTGLPPAPICLPSKATIAAVLNAPETGYLYFCASDKMDGTHRFATTLAEHNRNAAAFHRALNARGIR